MITKEEAKQKIQKLVEKFKSYSKKEVDSMPEEKIKNWFIEPLFEALGWSRYDMSKEERILKGRADYLLRIGNQDKLVIEAKKTSVGLNEEEGKQAVSYAYHKNIKFAVLTNFSRIRVYHALSHTKYIDNNLLKDNKDYLRFNCEDFIKDFDRLWFLSRESFEKEEINSLLKNVDKKLIKPIDKSILTDLLQFREWLSKDLKSKRMQLEDSQIDEVVQILIDRLIFMRSVEDRGLEGKDFLLTIIDSVQKRTTDKNLWALLKDQFKRFDNTYNSKLFAEGLLEKEGAFADDVLIKTIKGLYYGTQHHQERYMFDEIPVDLLGSIYEQYLGVVLRGTEKRVKLDLQSGKRKKMGIYYTPSYIVDYIVKNTIGEYCKNKSLDEILNIKVVDPACGSGSFLIRAFQELINIVEDKLKKGEKSKKWVGFNSYNEKLSIGQKATILLNCIYGVDLDEKAVELAQLNLLLKILEEETRETRKKILPNMKNNIKCGNSLISDSRFDKAFNWNAQFPDVFRDGGFDVVVGNPPYVKARDSKDKISRKFIEKSKKFKSLYKMWDLYIPFIERGTQILKEGGVLSMIIPDTLGVADYTKKLVEILIKNFSVYQIDFFPKIEIFEGVGIRNKIIFLKKSKEIKKCKQILHNNLGEDFVELDKIENDDKNIFKLNKSKINFTFEETIPLKELCYVSYGARFNSDKKDPKKFQKKDLISDAQDKNHTNIYTEGKYLNRYFINKELFVEWGTERCPKRLVRKTFPQLYPPDKLLMSRQKGVSTLSKKGHICDNTIILGVPYISLKGIKNNSIKKYLTNLNLDRDNVEKNSEKFNLKYLLGIINSKFVSYFLRSRMRGKIDIYPDDWKEIPIKIPSKLQEQKIVGLVEQMLELQKKLHKEKVSGNVKEQLEQKIKNVDYEIDEEVYKLYGLDKDEIKIVEESLK